MRVSVLLIFTLFISCASNRETEEEEPVNEYRVREGEDFLNYHRRMKALRESQGYISNSHDGEVLKQIKKPKEEIINQKVFVLIKLKCKYPYSYSYFAKRKFLWQSQYHHGWLSANTVGELRGEVEVTASKADYIIHFTHGHMTFDIDFTQAFKKNPKYPGLFEKELILNCLNPDKS